MAGSRKRSRVLTLNSSSSEDDEMNDKPNTEPLSQDPDLVIINVPSSSENGSSDDEEASMPSTPNKTGEEGSMPSTPIKTEGEPLMPSTPSKAIQRQQKREFLGLIVECEEIKGKEGFDKEDQDAMCENIQRGMTLLGEIEANPSVMYLAYNHTECVSDVVKDKTAKLGLPQNAFRTTGFFAALMAQNSEQNVYNPKKATMNIFRSSVECSVSLIGNLFDLCGTLDHAEQKRAKAAADLGSQIPLGTKEKETRAPRIRREFDHTLSQATQRETVTLNADEDDERSSNSKTKTADEKLSEEILKVVKRQTQRNPNKILNLADLTLDKDSFENTVKCLFGAAHLVKDGDLEVYKDGSRKGNSSVGVKLAQQSEPSKDGKNKQKSLNRKQHIVSFSAKQFREMQAKASGGPMVKIPQQSENKRK